MLLTIDVGNTNIVLGGFEGDELKFVSRVKTDKDKMPDEYGILFRALLDFYGIVPAQFDGAVLSSVVPPLLPALKTALGRLLSCRVLTVSPGTKTGLNIKIDDPSILGGDLVCGAVGALKRYPMPCVVVDLGTATKFSVLGPDGAFLGGPILPGVGISLEALSRSASLLPHVEFDGIGHVIGTNTPDCIRAGMVYGTACMVDGVLGRIEEELGRSVTAVITGGLAQSILPYCRRELICDKNLLLYGLKEIFEKNVKK